MFSQSGRSLSINIIQDNPFPYLPPIVDIDHLCENNKLLTDKQIEEAKEWFISNTADNIVLVENPLNIPVTIIKLRNPKSAISSLYAIYYGIKPKSYTLSKYDEKQPLEKWKIYIENSAINGQFRYTVIDFASQNELFGTITAKELPALKSLKYPYPFKELEKYSYEILKITHKRGHTIRKRMLGEGGFGSVRVMQNLETGEWCALKKMYFSKHSDPEFIYQSEEILNDEVDQLAMLDLLLGDLNYDKENSKHIKFVGMKLIPGMNLMDIKKSKPPYSQIQWLTLFTKLLELTLNLYRSGYLHLDIKLENIIFNSDTNEVNFVDLGLFTKGPVLKTDSSCGTEGYIPPEFSDNQLIQHYHETHLLHLDEEPTLELLNRMEECKAYILSQGKFYYFNKFQQLLELIPVTDEVFYKLEDFSKVVKSHKKSILLNEELMNIKYLTRHKTFCIYDEKSMVYTIGIVISELINFYNYDGKNHPLIKSSCDSYKKNPYLLDSMLKKDILKFLKSMTDLNSSKRPTLQEAFNYFKSKTLQSVEVADHTRKIGVIDIDEYYSQNDTDKSSLHTRLKLMDEIWFIDIHLSYREKYYQLRRELENLGIKIGNHILSSPKKNISALKILDTTIRTINTNSVNAYFYITNSAYHLTKREILEKQGICLLLENSPIYTDKKIKSYLCETALLKEQYEMLMLAFSCQKDKLLNKYESFNAVAQRRIALLNSMIEYLQQAYKNKALTYAVIDNTLKELSITQLSLSTKLLDLAHKQRTYFNCIS